MRLQYPCGSLFCSDVKCSKYPSSLTDPMSCKGMAYTYSLYLFPSLCVSLVCLPRSSGRCTAQLFSRWSVMIRELLEAVTLLKCSTAVRSWSTMLKCPQRGLEQRTVSLKLIVTNSAAEFVFIHIQTGSQYCPFFFFNCFAEREFKPLF